VGAREGDTRRGSVSDLWKIGLDLSSGFDSRLSGFLFCFLSGRLLGQAGYDSGDGWWVEQHVGVAGISHWASALASVDALAQSRHTLAEPDRPDVVIVFTQVTDGFGPDTTTPDVAVGRDVATCPTGVTGDDLSPLVEGTLGELVILSSKALGDTGNATRRTLACLLAEEIGDGRVFVGISRHFRSKSIWHPPSTYWKMSYPLRSSTRFPFMTPI